MQIALLGEITPSIIAITGRFGDDWLKFKVFFDSPISQDDEDLVSIIETEVIALFPAHHKIDGTAIRPSSRLTLPDDEIWFYARQEPE